MNIDPLIKHVVIFSILVFNLWVGGILIEIYVGTFYKFLFESVLILGYLAFIVRLWPFGRSPEEEDESSSSS